MDNPDVMIKYQQVVDDYNNGMEPARICDKYRLANDRFDDFLEFLKKKGFAIGVPESQPSADGINFQVLGNDMQYVELDLKPGMAVIAEAGVLMYLESGIEMETTLGEGSARGEGVLGAALVAGKRALTGASLFLTAFTNQVAINRKIAFAAPYPGKIVPLDLGQLGGEMICHKEAFLCAARGVDIDIYLQKKISVGFFGGEGFIMQRLQGHGLVFIHAGGTLMSRDLQRGETLKVDAGCLVAFQPGVRFDIEYVGGIKNAMFGGAGAFFATVTGPGKVWLQSMPFSRLVAHINARLPHTAEGSRGPGNSLPIPETSILGGIGGMLGGMLRSKNDD